VIAAKVPLVYAAGCDEPELRVVFGAIRSASSEILVSNIEQLSRDSGQAKPVACVVGWWFAVCRYVHVRKVKRVSNACKTGVGDQAANHNNNNPQPDYFMESSLASPAKKFNPPR
jgi:hypothetical protein